MGLLDFLKKKKKKKMPSCSFKFFLALDMIAEYNDIGGSLHRLPIEMLKKCKFDGLFIERRGVSFWATFKYKTVSLYSKTLKLDEMPDWLIEKVKKDKFAMSKLRAEGLLKRLNMED